MKKYKILKAYASRLKWGKVVIITWTLKTNVILNVVLLHSKYFASPEVQFEAILSFCRNNLLNEALCTKAFELFSF